MTLTPELLAILAAAAGLLLGVLVTLLVSQRGRRRLENEHAALEAVVKNQQLIDEERQHAIGQAAEQLSNVFEQHAHVSLKQNSETFLKLAEQSLGVFQERARGDLNEREQAVRALVKPLTESLKRTEEQIAELEKARREAYGGIQTHLRSMHETQKTLQAETKNLVTALRRPEVRGQWGEITLRRLVELAGMSNHCDFIEQAHTTSEDGPLRPDLVVRLPNKRELVVDVKTPLDAYIDAVEANNPEQRKVALARHAKNLRTQVRKLAEKSYWSQFSSSPEFVILFVPGDQFLTAALDADPALLDDALRQKVILTTPTSFVALLKAVAYGWRQLSLAENAEVIRTLAEDLHKRLLTFRDHFERAGRQLAGAVDAYNKVSGSLERNVLPGARKFSELGVTVRRELEPLTEVESNLRSNEPAEDKTA